ncbi:MAG: c-type cytochrome biogenesis protein CcmI [Rhodospirillales bacterium]|nr:MAG: c-type cytochrome biogenesis protein CcmI [Rhodospirillales bacterium]
MAVAAVAGLALPLFRGRVEEVDPAEFDLEVYRDQIAELERDHERGVLTQAEMKAARTEIARRILAADSRLRARPADQGTGSETSPSGRAATAVLAVFLAILVPLGAFGLYLELGQPGRPDMPLSARVDQAPADQTDRLDSMVARLEQAVEADPDDPDAWFNLGLVYKQQQRFRESAEALAKGFTLRPATPMLNSEYGESLVMAAEGTVSQDARAAFEAVLAERPEDIRARHYLALAEYQAGRTRAALDGWATLIEISPADAPWLDVIREYMAQAATDLGIDLAEVMPEPRPRDAGDGLTAEQRAELDAMSPEERKATLIRMLEELEARLEQNPMDLEGWEQLIRARHAMDEQEAAQAALDRAIEVFARAPFPTQRLAGLADELGLDGPATPDDVDIAGMVERLAARLQDEPDDLEGWLMLARSYTVMGERDNAEEAMANAARLAPDDPRILALQAATIRDANGGEQTEESLSILRRVLSLDPDHTEALWFVGNAEAEAGNTDKAIEMLERIYQQAPETSEERTLILRRIDEIRGG